jgi:hypothetical protein
MSMRLKRARRLALATMRRARMRSIRATERIKGSKFTGVRVHLSGIVTGGGRRGEVWHGGRVRWPEGLSHPHLYRRSPSLSARLLGLMAHEQNIVSQIGAPVGGRRWWNAALRRAARAYQRELERDIIATAHRVHEEHRARLREAQAAALRDAIQRVLPPGVQLVTVIRREDLPADHDGIKAALTRAVLGRS